MSTSAADSTTGDVKTAAKYITEGVKEELNSHVLKPLNDSIAAAAAAAVIATQASHEETVAQLLNLIPVINSLNQRLERIENLLAANATPATSTRRVNATTRAAAGAGAATDTPAVPTNPDFASSHSRSALYWGHRLSSIIGTGPECIAEADRVVGAINLTLASVNPELATIKQADIISSWETMTGSAKKTKTSDPARYQRGAAAAVIKEMTQPQKDALKTIWSARKKEEQAAASTKQLVPS